MIFIWIENSELCVQIIKMILAEYLVAISLGFRSKQIHWLIYWQLKIVLLKEKCHPLNWFTYPGFILIGTCCLKCDQMWSVLSVLKNSNSFMNPYFILPISSKAIISNIKGIINSFLQFLNWIENSIKIQFVKRLSRISIEIASFLSFKEFKLEYCVYWWFDD